MFSVRAWINIYFQLDCRVKHQAADPYSPAEHELLDRTILTAGRLLHNRTGRRLPVERYQLYPQLNR